MHNVNFGFPQYEPRHEKIVFFAYAKTKSHNRTAGQRTPIVNSHYFLKPRLSYSIFIYSKQI